ncbi:hypothetical protein ACIQNU_42165 [Streptomyces sp. NPDC091292]|uniref:hypothetical protein n=1 Tax=Streptomyces sp. NPDC091292 TaxID=3365991 RepID=UPI0038069B0B
MSAITRDALPMLAQPHRNAPTISEQFGTLYAQHSWIYATLEQLIVQPPSAGAERVGTKSLFETLRRRHPQGVKGLNNNYTALYSRMLLAAPPEWASVLEARLRRRP